MFELLKYCHAEVSVYRKDERNVDCLNDILRRRVEQYFKSFRIYIQENFIEEVEIEIIILKKETKR